MLGEYPTPMLMLPFPINATRYALCPVAMQLKIGKDRECDLVQMLRSRTGRSICRKKGKKWIPKHRRYAIKNHLAGSNHQNTFLSAETLRNSNPFVERRSERETKQQPLCWGEKCHPEHRSLCWEWGRKRKDPNTVKTRETSRYAPIHAVQKLEEIWEERNGKNHEQRCSWFIDERVVKSSCGASGPKHGSTQPRRRWQVSPLQRLLVCDHPT